MKTTSNKTEQEKKGINCQKFVSEKIKNSAIIF